jgi:thiol-disulfide isomerase/thioredoxin
MIELFVNSEKIIITIRGGFLNFLIICLFLTWCSILVSLIIQMRKFKKEVSFLGTRTSNSLFTHPAIGYDVNHLFSLSEKKMFKTPGIIIFSMSKCPHCHTQLEEFLELNDQYGRVPTLVVLTDYDKGNGEDFVNKYKSYFPIDLTPFEKLDGLHIDRFPTFMLIDEDGKIKKVHFVETIAYNFFNSYIRGKTKELKQPKAI